VHLWRDPQSRYHNELAMRSRAPATELCRSVRQDGQGLQEHFAFFHSDPGEQIGFQRVIMFATRS